ncbi:hypothetical protein AMATHDRAFT_49046 [Amanita thiersii Skay4041]|uniref:Uncharacterized protein n=1 Tax=Amanita thiersii Skay4041 TaxID=703135 RepID=A0A2A9NG14_9AGAR|nr:hypothetical protein AMATHDRAFT_49046 [Amanita thiersii Skay4041]
MVKLPQQLHRTHMEIISPIDLADLGQSNREYSKLTMGIIQQLAGILEYEIHQLDELIEGLWEADDSSPEIIASWCAKRAILVKQRIGCTFALAPHKRLPAEIIQQIFLLCIEGAGCGMRLPIQCGSLPIQIVLTHVCRFWRHVALTTPSLWSVVKISNFLDDTLHLGAVRAILSRVNGKPLSLSISQGIAHSSGEAMNGPLTTFVNTLQRDIFAPHQIRKLSLMLNLEYVDHHRQAVPFVGEKVQEIFRTSLLDLEILDFSIHNTKMWGFPDNEMPPSIGPDRLVSTTNSLPSLKVLRLNGDTLLYKYIYDSVCWEQLRTLSLKETFVQWALAILSQCRLLESFSVMVKIRSNDAASLQSNDLHISLPHLHRLKLSFAPFSSNRDMHIFLNPLSLPNLKSLHYRASDDLNIRTWPHVHDPLIEDRLQIGNLQELELYPCDPYWQLAAWKNARSVRRLYAFVPKFDDDLAVDLANGTLFPLLHDITIECPSSRHPSPFFTMIDARQTNAAATVMQQDEIPGDGFVVPFTQVGFQCRQKFIDIFQDRIEELRNGGLELNIFLI